MSAFAWLRDDWHHSLLQLWIAEGTHYAQQSLADIRERREHPELLEKNILDGLNVNEAHRNAPFEQQMANAAISANLQRQMDAGSEPGLQKDLAFCEHLRDLLEDEEYADLEIALREQAEELCELNKSCEEGQEWYRERQLDKAKLLELMADRFSAENNTPDVALDF